MLLLLIHVIDKNLRLQVMMIVNVIMNSHLWLWSLVKIVGRSIMNVSHWCILRRLETILSCQSVRSLWSVFIHIFLWYITPNCSIHNWVIMNKWTVVQWNSMHFILWVSSWSTTHHRDVLHEHLATDFLSGSSVVLVGEHSLWYGGIIKSLVIVHSLNLLIVIMMIAKV